MNEKFTAGMPITTPWSMIMPCSGGINAPPTIAMTKPAAPKVDSSFKPSKAIP
jgi:hypothetical protein